MKLAYENLSQPNKPQQPVKKVSLHVYRNEDETIIDEIIQQEVNTSNLGNELERVPASGGNAATQHILQTLIIQQRNLHRTMQN